MEWMLKNLDFIWPLKLTLDSQIPSLVTGVGRDLPSPLLVIQRKRGIGGWTRPLPALTLGLPLRKIVSSSSLICLFFNNNDKKIYRVWSLLLGVFSYPVFMPRCFHRRLSLNLPQYGIPH